MNLSGSQLHLSLGRLDQQVSRVVDPGGHALAVGPCDVHALQCVAGAEVPQDPLGRLVHPASQGGVEGRAHSRNARSVAGRREEADRRLPQLLRERILGDRDVQAHPDHAPAVLAGDKRICLGITEPSGGSDVAQLKTRAVREGDEYVVNGSKMFITGGMRADYITTAVRTGGPGMGGISLLLIDAHAPGVTRTNLKKQGWWASDTAAIYFQDVRVPAANLIGGENQGFIGIMLNFNGERLGMAAGANAYARVCLEEAVKWARERMTFGKRLADHQVIRHKIADMVRQINATQSYLEMCAWRVQNGETPAADLALLKVQATLTMEYCAREAMQILGGNGYMRGSRVERIYREVRVNAIGGGSEEIMRDLAARQMGL